MADRRVERVERPRDEGVYVSRIGEEKKEKQKYSELPENREKKLLVATFFSYLKKIFDSYSPSKKIAGKIVDLHSIIKHLEKLKELFIKLTKRDLSNSPEYATELSDHWSVILEDCENIAIMQRKEVEKTASFRIMVDTVKNYPPDSEHRFGYYLLQHAGKDWLPFPFIEILQNLHQAYLADPNSSTLSQWLLLIDDTSEALKKNLSYKGF